MSKVFRTRYMEYILVLRTGSFVANFLGFGVRPLLMKFQECSNITSNMGVALDPRCARYECT